MVSISKEFTIFCQNCDFSKETECPQAIFRDIISEHLNEYPTHSLDIKRNGYGYVVMCNDCGFHEVEPDKDLAELTKKQHRREHYGHDVDIKRKSWNNTSTWDLETYKSFKSAFPHSFNNKFSKHVIFMNFDDDNIGEDIFDELSGRIKE